MILDSERSDRLEPALASIYAHSHLTGVLVLHALRDKALPTGAESYHDVLNHYSGELRNILDDTYPFIYPEDNATIMFTSGRIASNLK